MKTNCYAKINHYLVVKNTLKNNLHVLDSVMQKIDLFDVLELSIKEVMPNVGIQSKSNIKKNNVLSIKSNLYKKFRISEVQLIFKDTECYRGNKKQLKTNDNLIIKGLNLYLEKISSRFDISFNKDVILIINIEKNIPLGGGLGGGSSNAASIVNLMQEFLIAKYKSKEITIKKNNKSISLGDFRLKKNDKTNISKNLGSDVSFFIHDINCARVSGTGEIVKKIKGNKGVVLLYTPKVKQSTKQIYKKFDELSSQKSKLGLKRVKTNYKIYEEVEVNDLQEAFFCLNKRFIKVRDQLKIKYPKSKVMLTGSGSTIFVHLKYVDRKKDSFNLKKVKLLEDK